MKCPKRYWWLFLCCIIGGSAGWFIGELLVILIDKRIEKVLGG